MTGIPAVNIPLYTIELRGGSFPISLSYHASGMKPDEMGTSLVGAGWSLSAEPLVSRKINSKPDEIGGGYLNNTDIMQGNTWDYFRKIANGSFEEDADKFYYKLLSKSGSFYLKKNTSGSLEAKTVPLTGVKLDGAFTTSAGYNQLKLYDEDGSIYYFGNNNNGYGALESTYPPQGYRSCWKASKVELPKTAETIQYKYYNAFQYSKWIKGNNISVETFETYPIKPWDCVTGSPARMDACSDPCTGYCAPYNRLSPIVLDDVDGTQKYLRLNANNQLENEPCPLDYPTSSYQYSNVERRLLKEIIFPNGRIEFTTILVQYQMLLSSMVVYNNSNQKVKEFKFYYTPAKLLKSIEMHGSDGVKQQAYQFAYHNLANTDDFYYLTDAIDTWGYYNGRIENVGRVPVQTISTIKETTSLNGPIQQNVNITIGNALYRDPDEYYAKTGMLKEIVYPTGGTTRFDYESNQYRIDAGPVNTGAGLRIKSIIHKDGATSQEIKKTYKYGQNEDGAGILRLLPDISDYEYEYKTWYYPDGGENSGCPGWHVESTTKNYTSGLFDLFYDNGVSVVYDKVTEYIGDVQFNIGKTENFYEIDNYKPFRWAGTDLVMEHPYSGLTGRLFRTIDYKNVNGVYSQVKKKEFVYNAANGGDAAIGRKVYSKIRFANLSESTEGYLQLVYPTLMPQVYDQYQIAIVSHHSFYEQILQETETLFAGSEELITVKKYKYQNATMPSLVTSIETTNSKNELQTESLYYTNDIAVNGASLGIATPIINTSQQLKQNNVLNYLVYKKDIRNTDQKTLINTPNLEANIVKAESFVNNNPVNSVDFTYDANKRLVQQQAVNDVKLSYLWDYSGQYPVAEINNATASSIAYTSFETNGTGGWTLAGWVVDDVTAPTGKKAAMVGNGIIRGDLSPEVIYRVSYWSKNGMVTVSGNIAGNGFPRTGPMVNNWTYYEHRITGVNGATLSGGGLVDELRLYPEGAQMNTYTYEPLVGMTSKCDANNRITYFEYDAFGRLSVIRDKDRKVIKKMEYKLQSQ
jgi:YD repeat-containing protein